LGAVIAKVEPLTTARAVRGPFDYRLPEHMSRVGVGTMLVVPFARRRMLGVVVEVAQQSEVPADRLVEPLEALEQGVPAELVSLALWLADAYCSTPARALGLVLPPGTGRGERPRIVERRELRAALTSSGQAVLAQIGERRDALLRDRGDRDERLRGRDGGAAPPRLGPRQRAALEALAAGACTVADLVRASGCGHASVRGLEARGLLKLEQARLRRRPPPPVRVGAEKAPSCDLTSAQREALGAIVRALDAPSTQPGVDRRLLLHGVTGSGKTEVYLEAVAAALERGRSAIVLVPEIALTPQTLARFEARFGDAVAVLHSRLRPGERHDEWIRLRSGEARVCVGPRSAVFAPVRDLGLVVVDEEHDASYKQEGDPRYDARRVAERRAEKAGAVLLAGTATPRTESYQALRRLALPERVDGRVLPPIELVSTLGAAADSAGGLHPRTHEALAEVRRRGEKAIVLLNRRGWSSFLACRTCARVWGCPRCDVTLVLHRAAAARLECHHCGHHEPVPDACPDCGSVSVARHGAGTERLEETLRERLDPLPVVRLDADAAMTPGGVVERLASFDAAPAGVLLGTQMVAKGHDFPDVTLAVVLDADATLRFPDFRAEERTFALVAQLAGRSGRGPRGGRVIVQALEPEARALRCAARHDAEGFVRGELERRRLLGYPPFTQLVRIVCSAPEPGPERRAAEMVAERLSAMLGSAGGRRATVLGPAPLFRRKGRERSQVVVKAGEPGGAVEAVRRAVEEAAGHRSARGTSFAVDVDPH
jgi:primosomal protein N' (replication factor Y) (superfamily II helicase)